jgi:hypothetical protein
MARFNFTFTLGGKDLTQPAAPAPAVVPALRARWSQGTP